MAAPEDAPTADTQKRKDATRAGGFFPVQSDAAATRPAPRTTQAPTERTYAYPLDANETCVTCASIEVDADLLRAFGVRVCTACRAADRESYTTITKSTARDEFLLTDEELRDASVLPCITRPNPHKATWTDMQLYLRMHVAAFAHKKWGGPDGLEAEKKRRADARETTRQRRFSRKLSELRKKTRSSAVSRAAAGPAAPRHEHAYGAPDAAGRRKCATCGISVVVEEL